MSKTEPRLGERARLGLALARFTWRRLFIRLVAITSCIVAIVGVGASIYAYRKVGDAQHSAQVQLRQIGDTFAQVSLTLRTVSISSANAATSVDDAKTSLNSASATTRGAATTLDQTGSAINISIPGLGRPFASVESGFRDQARQLRTLADQVDQTGGSLNQNAQDLRAIGGDVTTMSSQMNEVSGQLRQFAGDGPGPSALDEITNGTRLILSWSVIVHLLLLGMGFCLYLLTLDARPTGSWAGEDGGS